MAQMLVRMERDGLIRRTPDPADGRSSRITLTEAAHARLPQACSVLLEGNREVLSGFTDEEAAQLIALLMRLITNLDRVTSAELASRPTAYSRHTPKRVGGSSELAGPARLSR